MTSTRDPAGWPEADCRTPAWVVRAIVPRLLALGVVGPVVDLGCGTGAIADVLAEHWPVSGVDVRPGPTPATWHRVRADVLGPLGSFGAAVSNPPFLLGPKAARYDRELDGVLRFTERAIEIAPVACVLHRSGLWHEQQPARRAWRAWLRAGWVTERWAVGRVNFLGHLPPAPRGQHGQKRKAGGDSTPYAWLICRPPTDADAAGPWPTREYDCDLEGVCRE